MNLVSFGKHATVLHGEAWPECIRLNLAAGVIGDGLEWSIQVVKPKGDSPGQVQAWDVGSLIEMAGASDVDILKIDIEGSELTVFDGGSKAWLRGFSTCASSCMDRHARNSSLRR